MPTIVNGPKNYSLPLWKGQDTSFIVNRVDPLNTSTTIDYDAGTTAKIVITQGDTDIEFDATVVGHRAHFIIDDDDVKDVRSGSVWRLQFSVNGSDRSPVVGKVVRKDV